ncbi:uncharacterized protein LOC6053324 isoform X2 [Culex quinquefasciatus]|uniref:uncharacterized protein LOC6053324 isoform X2 n=1 Tax=Culex quinquefasciatus TaxID=7176 RepID=UPI0018E32732|nr:uncharacterized protein LOC6053324 isoform X2 [Culex quinquefasciatus]
MANVDEEVGSSSSSSSSATTTPVATTTQLAGFRIAAGPQQDSGPRTVCGGAVGALGDRHHQQQQHGKGLALIRLLKEELKERECASLPPMVYDGKSDLCTLGSRPGMECVPLRSPADPYHYHHVTEQTKSLQELQNEVGALLEFRDLVIETFPDLKTKMASASAANSTLTGIPSSSLASSRREWEPGIRTRRKLTAKDHLSHQVSGGTSTSGGVVVVSSTTTTTDIHHPHHHHHHQHHHQPHSSSLISRSRSNSQSGGSSGGGGGSGSGSGHRKEPKSGDAQSSGSVVIQDSGFSTETSSSKETHSASSSTGNGGGVLLLQGGNVSNTTAASHQQRLDTEDELWNLLDVIHRKSNRLREEVDALQQLEREKCRTNVLNQNVVGQNVATAGGGSSSSSNSSNNNHHHIHSGSSGSSSSSSGNLPHHHHAAPTTTTVGGLAKTFQNQLLVDVVNKDDVQILRKERDRLFEQLSDYEAEAMASRIRATKMQDDVDVLAAAKRDLEGQLQAALSQKLELNTKIHDLHQQFVNKSAPSSPDSIKSRHLQTLTPSSGVGLLRKHSSTDSTTTTLHLSTSTTSSPSSNSQQHLLKPSATRAGSSFAPIVKSSAKAEAADHHPTSPDAALGKLDGLLSSPARVNKVRMTDSKKIAAILLETNIVELQRHLLTITVQNQVLQQRLEYATRSRIFMSKKLDKSKEDIDDLKFRLEEKNIELEGTKAQLRVLESKQQQHQSGKSSVASSGFSPEHHPTAPAIAAAATPTALVAPVKPSVVSTSAGGIVTSQPFHHQQRDLTLRLQQASQVSTPSMKAMIPLAMDEVLHHSSSTESAQDQAERLTYPETPKRKPSKIPLPGTKGYVAPKPPTGRNFVANAPKNSPSPSGSLSNKSLNKSTGSLYMRSTGPSSISSGNRVVRDTSMNRPESAQSWSRRDTSLEKSRSSSIPVSSKGSPVAAKPPPSAVVSSSPQPKAKRDSLTTRVKNLDSLSRLQTAASTGNLSKSSSKKDLSSTSFSTGRPKQASGGGGIRRVSSASIGRSSSTEHSGGSSSNGSSSVAASPTDNSDNGKARRTNTFRLARPTLMPPLAVPSLTATAPPRGGGPQLLRRSHLPVVVPTRKPTAAAASTLIIMASSPDATAHDASSSSCSSGSGSSPSSVTTVTTIESHSSSTQAPPASRDLIGEYLAAKSRTQGPPAILIPQQAATASPSRRDADDLELAYKHPILLMNDEDEQNVFCSVVSSVGNERNREVEVRYVDDNSIELLDAREDFGEGEKESLIVPKPKKMAFHSLKGSPVKNGADDQDAKCRLVGKVNPNILKTWEQLSGGDKGEPVAKRKSSLITVTSSENSADSKQSCLIFYRNQYNNLTAPEEEEFHVNRIQHGSVSTTSSSSTMEEPKVPRTTSMVTSTTTTETTSSEGCYDFYDSIDDSSTRIDGVVLEEDEDDDEYAMAAGEGLADFTSLDRKKMMWSIDVE